ncbi:molybdenum cofactor guanylyltransferase [Gilvimarinus sp. F26214L]|uniref:molybdenum cofactor guanylyltransferase n=1 Tax=Gilvimarinus sp. DZF01 TaxID=3461371 RepID=UPI004045680A
MSAGPEISQADVTVAVLAGGRGSRMGGADKGLLSLGGRPLVERVLASVPAEQSRLIVANRNLDDYRRFGTPVYTDPWPDQRGPLAGILTAIRAAKTPWVQILPCEAIRLPQTMGATLRETCAQLPANMAYPRWEGQGQYLCCLLRRDLRAPLAAALEAGERRVARWLARERAVPVDLPVIGEPYIWSINTESEWIYAQDVISPPAARHTDNSEPTRRLG